LSEKLAKQDPFLIPKLQFNVGEDDLRVNFEAEDILLRGFSRFNLTDLTISAIQRKADFNVRFEQFQVMVPYYNLDAFAVFIPFYGSGTMNLVATGIDLGGAAKIGLTGEVKELEARFNLTESNLRITGLLHNEPMSDIVSVATTECFPEFINTYGERLGEIFSSVLIKIINKILKPETPYELPTSGGDTVQIGPHSVTYKYQL